MLPIHCIYGQEAQKEITNNLGRYVQHVVGLPDKSVDLVKPGGGGGALGGMVLGVGMAMGVSGVGEVAKQVSRDDAARSAGAINWLELKTANEVPIDLIEAAEMDDIEVVLGLKSN